MEALWRRYLAWRRADGVAPPVEQAEVIKKVAADDGAIASTATANVASPGS